jgi:hypothetical protein
VKSGLVVTNNAINASRRYSNEHRKYTGGQKPLDKKSRE